MLFLFTIAPTSTTFLELYEAKILSLPYIFLVNFTGVELLFFCCNVKITSYQALFITPHINFFRTIKFI